MSYLIDARLERGVPSLTLIDAETGEQRLHWRCENTASPESAWQALFKRLALLSCTDRFSLIHRVNSRLFGEECVECNVCSEQAILPKTYKRLPTTLQPKVIPQPEKRQ